MKKKDEYNYFAKLPAKKGVAIIGLLGYNHVCDKFVHL